MKLYHGSTQCIDYPKLLSTPRLLDFGNGFYTTSQKQQAERWALIKEKRTTSRVKPIVAVYEFDEAIFQKSNFKIKIFSETNRAWLKFVMNNRAGAALHSFDIVKGPVANDKLYATLLLFETKVLTFEETIKRLLAHKLFDQISFHSDKAIKLLKFKNCYEVKSE